MTLDRTPLRVLVGRVMRNSGGSANPETVEKVIKALRGERVSFIPAPRNKQEPETKNG